MTIFCLSILANNALYLRVKNQTHTHTYIYIYYIYIMYALMKHDKQ